MRGYEIISIAGASYGEVNDMISYFGCYYTIAGCGIYIRKFFNGDIIMATFNLYTGEHSFNQHVINVNKVIDNLVVCNEDLTPYIYK